MRFGTLCFYTSGRLQSNLQVWFERIKYTSQNRWTPLVIILEKLFEVNTEGSRLKRPRIDFSHYARDGSSYSLSKIYNFHIRLAPPHLTSSLFSTIRTRLEERLLAGEG